MDRCHGKQKCKIVFIFLFSIRWNNVNRQSKYGKKMNKRRNTEIEERRKQRKANYIHFQYAVFKDVTLLMLK